MSNTRLSFLLVASIAASYNLSACGPASPNGAAVEKTQPMNYTGTIRVEGQPATRADVVAVGSDGAALDTVAATGGAFALPAGTKADKLLVRIYEPVVGILVRNVSGPGAYDFDVASEDIAELRGTVTIPDTQAFDWVELAINPVAVAGVPQRTVVDAAASFFVTRKLDRPTFELRVLRSSYYVWANRFVDGPLTTAGPRNLENGEITASGQVAAKPAFRGAEVAVTGNGALAIAMKVTTD